MTAAGADAAAGLPDLALTEAGLRPLRRIALGVVGATLALFGVLAAGGLWPGSPWLHEVRRSGLAAMALAALLIALAGLLGTWRLAAARRRAAMMDPPGDPRRVGRAARLAQAYCVVPSAALAGLIGWACAATLASPTASVPPDIGFALGGAAIVLAFPWLIAERTVAGLPAAALPEAAGLRTLLLLPVLCWPLLGLLQIATGLGWPATDRLARWLAILLALTAAELVVRAALRLFLPPPAPAAARAAVDSWLARALAGTVSWGARRRGGLAEPIRAHLGIDFARSWALAYVRAALPAVTLLLLAGCWGLSGVVLVGLDQRAIYERFGAPVAVLAPGAHVILPWPLGRLRWLEYGMLHDVALGGADAGPRPPPVAAEALPPPSADRLWEQAHPSEVTLLLASERAGQQGFQAVSLDLRVLWRVGMTDTDALHLAYRAADPRALVRNAAGRAVAAFFAGKTLDDVLGENRAAMAESLRAATQQRLDRFDSGAEVVAIVIEAIHPPAGAADAYHAVQAAEIAARTSIDAERGRAQGTRAAALQTANELVNGAYGAAADTIGVARADLTRFTADRTAAEAGGASYLLERYFASLTGALARAPLTILDHRLDAGDLPVLDVRPPASAGATGANGE